jgi:hypothetical protein
MTMEDKFLRECSIIPLVPGTKRPKWGQWEKYCTDKSPYTWAIAKRNKSNVGICCGPASGCLVLDVDLPDLFDKTRKENGWELPETRAHRTGSGKPHYFFKYPDDGHEYGNRSLKNRYGIDVRGVGGQVVAPGSIHPDTHQEYTVEANVELSPAPVWLLELARKNGAAPESPSEAPAEDAADVDIDRLPIKPATRDLIRNGKPAGERSEAIMTVLNALAGANLSDEDIFSIFEQHAIGGKYKEKGRDRRKWLEPQIAKARAYVEPSADSKGKEKKESHAQILIRLALAAGIELFHDEDQQVYARLKVKKHLECFPTKSRQFRMWMHHLFYRETGRAPSSEGYKGARGVLEAMGMFDGSENKTFLRVAEHDGSIFLDLANSQWEAVQITPHGWEVVRGHDARIIRFKGMRPIARPVQPSDTGEAIRLLRNHINVDHEGFVITVGWLLQALRPTGPYPVLAITGEAGAAKSTMANLLRRLIDPNKAALRTSPKNEHDLAIACSNSWAVVFDNLSGLAGSLSDALCRVSTGGGFATRMLYTDDEERLFDYMRPVILNGINTFIYRNDLADRTISVDLLPINKDKRLKASEVDARFEKDAPVILGGLLSAISTAMANIDRVSLPTLPRMADFALWVEAAETVLPWEPGTFQRVLQKQPRQHGEDQR